MRNKKEIMKEYLDEGKSMPSNGALSMLTVVNILEVLVDIRDILDERLLEIDKGLHELTTRIEAVIKDAATAVILANTKLLKEDYNPRKHNRRTTLNNL